MELIAWNEGLSVDIEEIDKQHQALIAMINELDLAQNEDNNQATLGRIIYGLIDYAGSHFATEERYFDQFGYPETFAHKKEHKMFVDEVSGFYRRFLQGDGGLNRKVVEFLSAWLKAHIKGSDKEYAPFLRERGLR